MSELILGNPKTGNRHPIRLFVSTLARENRADVVAVALVAFAEHLCESAETLAEYFSRVTLWPVLLLFLPKLNLISFGGETAGVRLDDVVLLIVILVLCGSWMTNRRFEVGTVPAFGFAVVGVFCLSNLLNLKQSNILYSLRLIEYLVFFWAGRSLLRCNLDFRGLVKLLVGLNCAFILLQYAGIVGGFSAEGYTSAPGRPFGLSANHPAEMGALLNLLFAPLAFDDEGESSASFWRWCLLIALCIFVTESRSALFVHCALTLTRVYRHAHNKAAFVLKSAFISGTVIAALAFIPNSLQDRSADLFAVQNLDAARQLYDTMPGEKTFTGFAEGSEAEDAPADVDVSAYMRGFKWMYVIKILFTAPWTLWILGLGPGSLGPALDGGWLRLLAETGVVGTVAFVTLLRKIWRLGVVCSMAVVALAINMVMVDSQNAYKVMAFLFLLAGVYAQKNLLESHSQAVSLPETA